MPTTNYLVSAKEGDNPKSKEEPETEITADHMRRWNRLIDHAKAKGYAGRPELDHDENLRKKVWDDYNKANPNDALPYSHGFVKSVQREMQKYKASASANLQGGKGVFDTGANASNFMSHISQEDGKWGQKSSQEKFPEAYIVEKGQKTKLGFAPKVNLLAALQQK